MQLLILNINFYLSSNIRFNMKKKHLLNIVFTTITLVLIGLIIAKNTAIQNSGKYYYVFSESHPSEYPILELNNSYFIENDTDSTKLNFISGDNELNGFHSYWTSKPYLVKHNNEPKFLPQGIFIKYFDLRTKKQYTDSIFLPKKEIAQVFNYAEEHKLLKIINTKENNNPNMGLEFLLGIANDGNIIFWLIGENFEKEFYRKKIEPVQDSLMLNDSIYKQEKNHLNEFLTEMDPKTRQAIRNIPESKAQYKDSIPYYFNNYILKLE